MRLLSFKFITINTRFIIYFIAFYIVLIIQGCNGTGNEFTNEFESIFGQIAHNVKGSVDSIRTSDTSVSFVDSLEIDETVAEKTLKSTVAIVVSENGTPVGIGSGVIVGKEKIITNYHVIKLANAGFVQLVNDKREYEITDVLALNKKNDLALLTVSGFNYDAIKVNPR